MKNKYKKEKEKKRTEKRNTVTITIALVFLFLINNILLSFGNFVKNSLDDFILPRTLMVTIEASEDTIDALEQYFDREEAILSYVVYSVPCGFIWESNQDKSGIVGVCNYQAIRPYLLTDECDAPKENEVIVAKYMTTGDIISMEAGDEWFDGETLMGQTLHGTMDTNVYFDYDVKVIGVYDNVAAGMSEEYLISADTMLQFYSGGEDDEDDMEGETVTQFNEGYCVYSVVLKENSQADRIMAELHRQFADIFSYQKTVLSPKLVVLCYGLILISNFIMFFIIMNTIVNIVYVTEHDIRERRVEFGILKAIGYRNRDISKDLFWEVAVRSCISVGITFLAGAAGLLLCNCLADMKLNIYCRALVFRPYLSIVCAVILIGTGAALTGWFVSVRLLRRLEAVEALRNED